MGYTPDKTDWFCARPARRGTVTGYPSGMPEATTLVWRRWLDRPLVFSSTVRQHAVSVYEKSGLQGRAELAAFFLEDVFLPNPR
jgi:hypothetical protein